MATRPAVLDASALVALILDERGSSTVAKVVKGGAAHTTATGVAEALNVLRRKGYTRDSEDTVTDIEGLGIVIEPITVDDATEIAYLQVEAERPLAENSAGAARIGSLSLGDACCLAVARRLDAVAVMSDATWELLDPTRLKIAPFR